MDNTTIQEQAKQLQGLNQNLPNEAYWNLFQVDPIGKQVFEELCKFHYDIESFSLDNQYETAYNEGRRHVVRWIIQKLTMAQVPNNNEE